MRIVTGLTMSKSQRLLAGAALAIVMTFGALEAAVGGDEEWVLGTWELVYDPEGRATDWLEFLPSGDVRNTWADGTEVWGIYVVTQEGVKAVLSYEGTDVIFTFHADERRNSLRIVTSNTGIESVYQKAAQGK